MVPPCTLLFGRDAHIARALLSSSVQGQLPDQGEILGALTLPRAVDIFAHGDIQYPVHAVFDFPMRPNHAVQALSIGVGRPWEGAEIVASLPTFLFAQLPDRLHHDQACESRPALTRVYPLKRFGTPDPTCLNPPMAAIALVRVATRDRLIAGMCPPEPREQVVTIAVHARLIFLSAQDVVCPLGLNLPGALYLAPHRIDGHHGSGQIEHAEPLGEGGHLVGCGVHLALRQYHLIGSGPRIHAGHRAFALRTVEGPPQGLPGEGHDVLGQVGEGMPPGDKRLLEARRVKPSQDPPKRIRGRNPSGQVQKCCEPRRLGMPPVCDLASMLRPANRRKDGDREDRLQRLQRARMLATWVVDNGEKSKHLVHRRGLGHGPILC